MALDTQLFSHSIKETCLAFTPSEKQRVNHSAHCHTHKCLPQTRALSLIHNVIPPWAHEPLKTQIVFSNKFTLYKDITKSAIKVRKQTLKQHSWGDCRRTASVGKFISNFICKGPILNKPARNNSTTPGEWYHCREITGLRILGSSKGDTAYLSALLKKSERTLCAIIAIKIHGKSIIMKDHLMHDYKSC